VTFLSVIIAAHNAEKTLTGVLHSLLDAIGSEAEQTEVIIINDNSVDSTQSIIEQWSARFPHFITRQVSYCNVGMVRNEGIQQSSGQYIFMLDSDDLLKPGSLQDAINFLRLHLPDMLITHLLEVRDLSKITSEWSGFNPISLTTDEAITRFLIHKDFQAHLGGQFIHRELFDKYPVPAISCYEDFAVFPAMLATSRKTYFQRNGHYYYVKTGSSLSSDITPDKIAHLVDCTLKMEEVFPDKFEPLINCHWFDIFINHRHHLTSSQREIVQKRVNQMYSWRFFMSKDVRFSYKKRALQALWKK